MSWTKLAPIVKTSGRPMASASIVVNKDGVPKISLIFSASLKDEFGDPKRADVMAGEGEHEGSLLVEFHAKGDFELKNFVHGGARLYVPIPPGCPDKPAGNAPCALGGKTRATDKVDGGTTASVDSVEIVLPVPAWKREIALRVAPPPRTAPPAPPPPPVGNGRQLDVVEYLATKGVRVQRLANNRFQVNGEVVLLGQVLKLVNEHRKAADLDPLSAAQVK